MERPILLVPNQTGAGHNMRALAIAGDQATKSNSAGSSIVGLTPIYIQATV